MVDDPLQKPLATWSTEDVSSLIGRSESQQLEVKGPELDITKAGDRKRLAQEFAGMMSADGGLVILGAIENDDVIEGLPGLDIDDPVVARLRSSLLDSVYPHPVVGVRAFPTPEGSSMVVLQIQPHPLGLPACVDGRFYRRSADQNREMTYDEVRRRFQSSSD